jgi:hypothetical protein
VVLDRGQVGAEPSIGLDNTSPANLEERDEGRPKVPTLSCQVV